MNFIEFIELLEAQGLTDVMLPFLLIFIVFFAVLQKTRILGEGKKNMNIAFSVVVALIAVIPHVLGLYPSENWDPVIIMNKALPTVSILVVAVIMLLILVGIFGAESNWPGGKISGWIAIAAFIAIVLIFGSAAGWWGGWDWLNVTLGSDTVSVIIILLVFGVLIAFITGGEKTEGEKGPGFATQLGDWLKKQ